MADQFIQGEWVVCSRADRKGNLGREWVTRFDKGNSFILNVARRRATLAEIAEKEAELELASSKVAEQRERESKDDWRNADYLMGCLEHNREETIAAIGEEELRRLAERVKQKLAEEKAGTL